MSSREVADPIAIQFSIDGRPRILRATDIVATFGLPVVLANYVDYRQWSHPSPREMVRLLSRHTSAGVYPVQATTSPEHAPHRSHLLVQPIPASAPRAEERSHSRGSVPDF